MPRVEPPLPPNLERIAWGLPPSLLRFKPCPVRARAGGWSPARQRGFIVRLALCGSPHQAALGVGKSRESAYRLRARAEAAGFARAWDRALDLGRAAADDLALSRALVGEVRPVFYKGRKVGEWTRYNDGLALRWLERAGRARSDEAIR